MGLRRYKSRQPRQSEGSQLPRLLRLHDQYIVLIALLIRRGLARLVLEHSFTSDFLPTGTQTDNRQEPPCLFRYPVGLLLGSNTRQYGRYR